ncbi:GNAT family N-acetyltransferase [Streptomyces lonarensis]|uniref:GNAT family N-acetyltransferase n=1 Tax=Streptomyces lonarensis TaxID=700599 RepID=A0A7X6D5R8_9ACTN|nr:GNAT family N-acetyltransferase [Streptomyces lonarensis]NJQ08674.1 GNAT family N-acetyltransferase [Streptomyces lonarensis]
MEYELRVTRGDDWQRYRELRLRALRDPAAPVSFFEPIQEALDRSPDGWRQRAVSHLLRTTFVAERASDGTWVGMATALLTEGGHIHVVGVFLRPEQRGTGLATELLGAAIAWAGTREVRLDVHEDNERAARFYRRLGFRPTGRLIPDPRCPERRTIEMTLAEASADRAAVAEQGAAPRRSTRPA